MNINTYTNTNNPNKSITIELLKMHNNEHNGWINIDNNIYDITNFIHLHPGGSEILKKNLGQNVTIKFHSILGHTTIDLTNENFLKRNNIIKIGYLDK